MIPALRHAGTLALVAALSLGVGCLDPKTFEVDPDGGGGPDPNGPDAVGPGADAAADGGAGDAQSPDGTGGGDAPTGPDDASAADDAGDTGEADIEDAGDTAETGGEDAADGADAGGEDAADGADPPDGGSCGGCDDGNPCTVGECNADGSCSFEPVDDGTPCDDGSACTESDACQDGTCVGSVKNCSDGSPCTLDACIEGEGCRHEPVADGTECVDGNLCTVGSTCQDGACQKGVSRDCDDDDPCTVDSCDPDTGCQNELDPPPEEINGVDDDCDGHTDEAFDLDHDGVCASDDCPTNETDSCPTVWNPDNDPEACAEPASSLQARRKLQPTLPGIPSSLSSMAASRRTNQPVTVPLRNGYLDASVQGYWPLDDGSAEDRSPHHRDGTISGATPVPGAFGRPDGGLRFQGAGSVEVGPAGSARSTGALSLSVHLRRGDANAAGTVASRRGGDDGGQGYDLALEPSGRVRLRICSGEDGCTSLTSEGTVSAGDWHHVVAVAGASGVRLYLDGQLDTTRADPVALAMPEAAPLFLGAADAEATNGFRGSLDEVIVASRGWSHREVEAYARSDRPWATSAVPGAQLDYDDVRVVEGSPYGDETSRTHYELLGARPHSDAACPDGAPPSTLAEREDLCGVVGYWRLDDDLAAKAGSLTGQGTEVRSTTGRFGRSEGGLAFDGENARVTVPDDPSLRIEQGTWELWVRPHGLDLDQTLIQKDGAGADDGLRLAVDADGKLLIRHDRASDAGPLNLTVPDALEAARWTHVGVTWNGSELRVYVDGVLAAEDADQAGVLAEGAPLSLGRRSGDCGEVCAGLDGVLDEVLVHDVAKSADYFHRRAKPRVPMVRFFAHTEPWANEVGLYRYLDYELRWGDAEATPVPPVVRDRATPSMSCYGLLSSCTGYAGWWQLDGMTDGRVIDRTVGRHHARVEGAPELTRGPRDPALHFSTPADRLLVDDGAAFDRPAHTIETLVRLETSDHRQSFVRKGRSGSGQPLNYRLSAEADGTAAYGAQSSEGATLGVFSSTLVADGAWHRVAARLGSEPASLFVDGNLAGEGASGGPAGTNDAPLRIAGGEDAGDGMVGDVASVRIMNRALARDELLRAEARWGLGPLEHLDGEPLDLDGDGVPDDGDGSGIVGDEPCTGGETTGCDDNCPAVPNPDQADLNGDGVGAACACGDLGRPCPEGFTCEGEGWCVAEAGQSLYVPSGTFWMGCNAAVDDACQSSETPARPVDVAAFEITRREVPAGAYQQCVNAGECDEPDVLSGDGATYGPTDKADHPINYVSLEDAQSYCEWALGGDGDGRLCTASEWEKAARGGCRIHCEPGDDECCKNAMPIYPWGNETPVCGGPRANFGTCEDETEPVDEHVEGASPYGVLNASGNVAEWVVDCWHPGYTSAPDDGSAWSNECEPSENVRVVRGGSYQSEDASRVRASARDAGNETESFADVGIRCCRTVDAE